MNGAMRIEGLAALKKALDDLPKATAKNVQRRVLLKRAQIVVDAAKAKAPVRIGHLRNSIIATTKRPRGRAAASRRAFAAAGGGAAGRAAAKAAGSDMVEVFVGPGRHPQAGQQEFGNRNHPPHPYLRPAWDETQRRVLDGIADDMWAEINKASARLAKKAARGK